jgi:hypothetical protein
VAPNQALRCSKGIWALGYRVAHSSLWSSSIYPPTAEEVRLDLGLRSSTHKGYHVTTIAILPEPTDGGLTFRAIAGDKQSSGRTLGEALDQMTDQFPGANDGIVVLFNTFGPDRFFDAAQQQRLAYLMERWRSVRDSGGELADEERQELNSLVEQEFKASAERTAALARELQQ